MPLRTAISEPAFANYNIGGSVQTIYSGTPHATKPCRVVFRVEVGNEATQSTATALTFWVQSAVGAQVRYHTHPGSTGLTKTISAGRYAFETSPLALPAGEAVTIKLYSNGGGLDSAVPVRVMVYDADDVYLTADNVTAANVTLIEGLDATDQIAASMAGAEVKLAADAFDLIPTTAPAGVASDFREMIVQLWRRFFCRATKSGGLLKTYDDDDLTVLTTQPVTDDNTSDEQGAAA